MGKNLQAQMAQVRDQNHIELVELHSKMERLSESTHCMGETLQARAESVHTELLRLQEAARHDPLFRLRCPVWLLSFALSKKGRPNSKNTWKTV